MKKIILTLAGFCFLVSGLFGQEIEWQNTIGGSNADALYSICPTTDGGFICGGTSFSNISGDKTEENCDTTEQTADYWIIKIDSAGNIQWQNTISGNDHEQLNSIQQTIDGGFIVAGLSSSNSSCDKIENSTMSGYSDFWILKLDPTGNIQWQNTIGGNINDAPYSVRQTTDTGYVIAGLTNSYISGDKTENCVGIYDYWVVKIDQSGNIQWQNDIGGSDWDEAYSIQQTTDGGYILGGFSRSNISGDKTENSMGGKDYWVIKLDSSGNIQWQNTIGGGNWDALYSIQQTSDGGYILGGSSSSDISVDKTENSMGGLDYWIVKLDTAGNIQWQNTIGGNADDWLFSIQQTTDRGYILGGDSYSNMSGDKTENKPGLDNYWVVKIDSLGTIQWQKTLGTISQDILRTIQQGTNGGYVLGGYSNSGLSGDKSENNNGILDLWVLKLTDKFNSITGKLFSDINSNGIQDAGEPPVSHKRVYELNTGKFSFSQSTGDYYLNVLDSGNFTVVSNLNYNNSVPVSYNAYFSNFHQTDSLNDFAFQPTGVFNDLCVTITPIGNFRANINANYMINYENVGTTTLNGTVIFFPDNDVTFVSSNVTPTSVTTDSVVWNVGTLTPFQTGSILVTVHVNAGTPVGTLINSSVVIEPVAGDANTACNYNSWEVFVTGSFDPNAILVDRDTVLTTELSSPPYLDYIIYFQNTGNDTAFNVRVLNNLPQRVDISSFEFVSSSHPVNITYGAHARLMTFTFDNILLPDSNVNEPASHGFIRYRVKPLDTLVAGNKIFNRAFIYFDFNQPVETNYAITEIVLPTGVSEWSPINGQLMLYPNPTANTLTIKLPQLTTDPCQLTTYDLFGREVYTSEIKNPQSEIKIDVSHFSQGVYFMELGYGDQVLRGKFLRE